MKQTHKKVPCPECQRMIDVRGISQHRMTHQPNIERETSSTKKGPISVDWDTFLAGYRRGLQESKVA